MKAVAKAVLPQSLQRRLKRPDPIHDLIVSAQGHALTSYAQEGEDLLLYSLLGVHEGTTPGFYVDVGAHHPSHYSNTLFFYLRGWRGINIDAMPGSMEPFQRLRPRDINVEAAVSDVTQALTYYSFNEPALNGFSKELSETRDKFRNFRLISDQTMHTSPLTALLEQHLPPGRAIQFLSVDVEGLDWEVLASNDWTRYRPNVVLVEDGEVSQIAEASGSRIVSFMRDKGYAFCCKTRLTSFFVEASHLRVDALGLHLAPPALPKAEDSLRGT